MLFLPFWKYPNNFHPGIKEQKFFAVIINTSKSITVIVGFINLVQRTTILSVFLFPPFGAISVGI